MKPELWVGYKKHGNFVELSKCTLDWLNLCVTTPALFSYKLHNVGEHRARVLDDLGALALTPILAGQYVWRCQGFLGGPAKILNDLYLSQFNYPGRLYWDDGDIVPYTDQVRFPVLCGS